MARPREPKFSEAQFNYFMLGPSFQNETDLNTSVGSL